MLGFAQQEGKGRRGKGLPYLADARRPSREAKGSMKTGGAARRGDGESSSAAEKGHEMEWAREVNGRKKEREKKRGGALLGACDATMMKMLVSTINQRRWMLTAGPLFLFFSVNVAARCNPSLVAHWPALPREIGDLAYDSNSI